MPGDSDASGAGYETTLAITIDAPAPAIWPWLVQMGYRRGGLYSYDWLDRACGFLDAPSATRILPEFQQLHAGDVVPVGRGGGFPVRIVDPCRALVLGGESDGALWLWQLGLYPVNSRQTRLVSRNRARPNCHNRGAPSLSPPSTSTARVKQTAPENRRRRPTGTTSPAWSC